MLREKEVIGILRPAKTRKGPAAMTEMLGMSSNNQMISSSEDLS
jgi:hypothetical protein